MLCIVPNTLGTTVRRDWGVLMHLYLRGYHGIKTKLVSNRPLHTHVKYHKRQQDSNTRSSNTAVVNRGAVSIPVLALD